MKPFVRNTMMAAMLTTGAHAGLVAFDDLNPGAPPPGWTASQTGDGKAEWRIESDGSAPSKPNVLKQSGHAKYPVCFRNEPSFKDGFVEVKFKPVAGHDDQAGGLIWRATDANNYYVVRANATENNVVLYKMVSGKRSPLDIVGRKGGYGVEHTVALGQWHTLRVEFEGAIFKAYLNGERLFEVEDHTFTAAGKVGVWTKADSITLFDDFSFGSKSVESASEIK